MDGAIVALNRIGYNRTKIGKEMNRLSHKNAQGRFMPYCNAVLWILDKKFKSN